MHEWEWQALEEKTGLERVSVNGVVVGLHSRVRLKPRPGGDALDLVLLGRTAIVESIEQDYDGRVHLAVVIEDDPGIDMGFARQPGHRFFFSPEEVEPIVS